MNDIVAALREDAAALGRQQANAGFGAELHIRVAKPGLLEKTLTDAATEIERLRALVSHYRGAMIGIDDIVKANRELTDFRN